MRWGCNGSRNMHCSKDDGVIRTAMNILVCLAFDRFAIIADLTVGLTL